MVDRSILSQNISLIIPYSTLYYSSEVCCKNKWYIIGEDNFLIHILLLTNIRKIFTGIDSSGFKAIHASQYYAERTKLRRRKYIKLSLGADVLKQIIICIIKIRRAPKRHDNIDFQPLIIKIAKTLPLSVVTADKGYDSEVKIIICISQGNAPYVQCYTTHPDTNGYQYGEHTVNIGQENK